MGLNETGRTQKTPQDETGQDEMGQDKTGQDEMCPDETALRDEMGFVVEMDETGQPTVKEETETDSAVADTSLAYVDDVTYVDVSTSTRDAWRHASLVTSGIPDLTALSQAASETAVSNMAENMASQNVTASQDTAVSRTTVMASQDKTSASKVDKTMSETQATPSDDVMASCSMMTSHDHSSLSPTRRTTPPSGGSSAS